MCALHPFVSLEDNTGTPKGPIQFQLKKPKKVNESGQEYIGLDSKCHVKNNGIYHRNEPNLFY